MSWLNIDDKMPHHPRVLGVSNGALGMWLRLACHCASYLTDGIVTRAVADASGTSEQLKELVTRGMLDRVKGGYCLHDYTQWNQSREQIEAKQEAARRRQKAWYDRKHGANGSSPVPNASADASGTQPTPLHSTPPPKGGSGGARQKGGQRPTKPATCQAHAQLMPCISCAADRKAGGAA